MLVSSLPASLLSHIVGNPIRVEQTDKPTLDEIRKVQAQYIDELMRCVRVILWPVEEVLVLT